MNILIIHPSRNRPQQALDTYNQWLSKSSHNHPIRYIMSLDFSDPQLNLYEKLFEKSKAEPVISHNDSAIDAINNSAKFCTRGDIIVQISDDFQCFPDWDMVLEAACGSYDDFVLKTFDGVQKWIVTLPIMDYTFYKKQGYFYFPEYKHMFADTDLTHYADVQGKLIFRNDITFFHNHYSTGGQQKDEVNIKADSTWNQGEQLYLKRVKENFGLGDIDVINTLSLEGMPHKNWLKNKLK